MIEIRRATFLAMWFLFPLCLLAQQTVTVVDGVTRLGIGFGSNHLLIVTNGGVASVSIPSTYTENQRVIVTGKGSVLREGLLMPFGQSNVAEFINGGTLTTSLRFASRYSTLIVANTSIDLSSFFDLINPGGGPNRIIIKEGASLTVPGALGYSGDYYIEVSGSGSIWSNRLAFYGTGATVHWKVSDQGKAHNLSLALNGIRQTISVTPDAEFKVKDSLITSGSLTVSGGGKVEVGELLLYSKSFDNSTNHIIDSRLEVLTNVTSTFGKTELRLVRSTLRSRTINFAAPMTLIVDGAGADVETSFLRTGPTNGNLRVINGGMVRLSGGEAALEAEGGNVSVESGASVQAETLRLIGTNVSVRVDSFGMEPHLSASLKTTELHVVARDSSPRPLIQVSGEAKLAGILKVTTAVTNSLRPGDRIELIKAASVTGEFQNATNGSRVTTAQGSFLVEITGATVGLIFRPEALEGVQMTTQYDKVSAKFSLVFPVVSGGVRILTSTNLSDWNEIPAPQLERLNANYNWWTTNVDSSESGRFYRVIEK